MANSYPYQGISSDLWNKSSLVWTVLAANVFILFSLPFVELTHLNVTNCIAFEKKFSKYWKTIFASNPLNYTQFLKVTCPSFLVWNGGGFLSPIPSLYKEWTFARLKVTCRDALWRKTQKCFTKYFSLATTAEAIRN